MTEDVGWSQGLIDKHAVTMLNAIRALPLEEKLLMILELDAKQLVLDVASDVMHETRDVCLKIFAENLKK